MTILFAILFVALLAAVAKAVDCSSYESFVKSFSPSVYYRLNETTGATVAVDTMGALNGTFNSTSSLVYGETSGVIGGGTAIKSTGGTMTTADNAIPAVGACIGGSTESWIGWYKWTGTETDLAGYNRWKSSSSEQFLQSINYDAAGDTRAYVRRQSDAEIMTVESSVTGLNDGAWHFIGGRVNTCATGHFGIEIFVDGTWTAGSDWEGVIDSSSHATQLWGTSDGNAATKPTTNTPIWADEIAHFPAALTRQNIADIYAAGKNGCLFHGDVAE